MKQEESDHSNVLLVYQFNNINMAHILKNFLSRKIKKKYSVEMQLPL